MYEISKIASQLHASRRGVGAPVRSLLATLARLRTQQLALGEIAAGDSDAVEQTNADASFLCPWLASGPWSRTCHRTGEICRSVEQRSHACHLICDPIMSR